MFNDPKERRNFRRYDSESDFVLNLDSGIFRSKIVDYSADGICILIQGVPPLKPGALFEVKIESPEMDLLGEVVWTTKLPSGLKVGIKRVSNICGSLRDFRLSDILIGLQRSAKTGILEITSGSIVKRIFVEDGGMIFAASNQEEDRLGEMLLKLKRISIEQYDKSVEMMRTSGERQGKVLVDLGYLKPKEVFWAVRHQAEEIILSLFNFEHGDFEFMEGPLPTEETVTLKISAANLIFRGIKRVNNFQYIRNDFPSMETILCLSSEPIDIFQDFSLDDVDKKILAQVNGKNSANDIFTQSPLGYFETLKVLYGLLNIGVITVTREAEAPPQLPVEELVTETEAETHEAFVEKIDEMYGKLNSLGYYGVLGIDDRASQEEIVQAYYRMSKEFHPDKHFSLPSGHLKVKLDRIFSLVTEAYDNLSDPEKRKAYDESLAILASLSSMEEEDESLLAQQRHEPEDRGEDEGVYVENNGSHEKTVGADPVPFQNDTSLPESETAEEELTGEKEAFMRTGSEETSDMSSLDEIGGLDFTELEHTVETAGKEEEKFVEDTGMADETVGDSAGPSGEDFSLSGEDVVGGGGIEEETLETSDVSSMDEIGGLDFTEMEHESETAEKGEEKFVEDTGMADETVGDSAVPSAEDLALSEEEVVGGGIEEETLMRTSYEGHSGSQVDDFTEDLLEDDLLLQPDAKVGDNSASLGNDELSLTETHESEIAQRQGGQPLEFENKREQRKEIKERPAVAPRKMRIPERSRDTSLPKWKLTKARRKRRPTVAAFMLSVVLLIGVVSFHYNDLITDYLSEFPLVTESVKKTEKGSAQGQVTGGFKKSAGIPPGAEDQRVPLPPFRNMLFAKVKMDISMSK